MFSPEVTQELEQILLSQGLLNEKDLEEAKTYAKNTDQDLASVLIEIGKLTEETVAFAISNALGLAFLDIIPEMVDQERLQQLSPETLWRCRAVPLFQGDEILLVMSNPLDEAIRKELLELFDPEANVNFAIATASSITEVLKKCFVNLEIPGKPPTLESAQEVEDPGAILFVTRHINEAYEAKAEELEFKPFPQELQVLYRIGDKMIQQESVPVSFNPSIANHLKALAGIPSTSLEVYQKSFSSNVQGENVQMRLSILNTNLGDRITIAFDTEDKKFTLEDLANQGISQDEIAQLLSLPQGLILLANPNPWEIRALGHIFLKEYLAREQKVFSIEMGITKTLPGLLQMDRNRPRFAWENVISEQPDALYIEGELPSNLWPYLLGMSLIWLATPCASATDALCWVLRQIPDLLVSRVLRAILVFAHPKLLCPECQQQANIPPLLMQLEPSLSDLTAMESIGCDACEQTGYKGAVYLTDLI